MPMAEQRLCLFIRERHWALVFWPAFFAMFRPVVAIDRICSDCSCLVEPRSTSDIQGAAGTMNGQYLAQKVPLLEQAGLSDEVDSRLPQGVLTIRPVVRPRAG